MNKKYITLREAAKEMNINKSTLHYYLSKGLIKPNWNTSGVFFFRRNPLIKKIKKIKSFQKDGLSLAEIKQKF